MKKFLSMAAIAALSFGAVSCSNDESINEAAGTAKDNVALQVDGVGLSAATKAGIIAESFTNGETLGLFIFKQADEATFAPTASAANYNTGSGATLFSTVNVPYAENEGAWAPVDKSIILSSTYGTVYSYYPYSAAASDATAIPVEVKATQTCQSEGLEDVADQIDYMWSDKVVGISNKKASVTLDMNHALSMMSFVFKQDATVPYPGEGVINSIVVKNAERQSVIRVGSETMNIVDGALTKTAAAGTITLTPAAEPMMDIHGAALDQNLAKMPRMLFFPATAEQDGDVQFDITVDGNLYNVKAPAVDYLAGKNYVYTLTLKGTKLEVTQVNIKKWIDEVGGSADLETPVQ